MKKYLPLAARVLWTAAAAAGPVVAALVAKQPVTNEILTASLVAGAAAWKRWHPSASLAALGGEVPDATTGSGTEP